jgi:hypothetical protein
MKPRILLLVLIFFVLVNCQVVSDLGVGKQAGAADEYAVYSALIKTVYQGDSTKTIVIQDNTEVDKQMSGADELQYVQRELKGVTQALADDFAVRNRQVLTLEQHFNLAAKVVLLKQADIQAIFKKGGWNEFYRQYPNSQGTLVLSRVGFNPVADQALVYAGNASNVLAGAGFYYLLARENGAWKIIQQLMVWVS